LAAARSPAIWLAAIRPQFLSVTAVSVLVGLAAAAGDGVPPRWGISAATLAGALLVHAGANVVNDFHDRDADAANDERLSPFTGGSRMIQDGMLRAHAVALYGYLLLALGAALGGGLALSERPQLWWLGVLGVALAIAYSAPPLRLSARGMGEAAIAAAWLLVTVGSDLAQRGSWSPVPVAAGAPMALLVAAILLANGLPDRRADAATGKDTLVVRLGPRAAAHAYLVLVAAAYLVLVFAAAGGVLPPAALVGLLAAPASLFAARQLALHGEGRPGRQLLPAIGATIGAAHLYGVSVALALVLARG